MLTTLRHLPALLDRRQRRRFLGLAMLGGLNGVLEALGAGLLYAFVNTLVDDRSGTSGALVGRIRQALPATSARGFV